MFSRDVKAAMLVSLNKGTAAILVSPLGIELYILMQTFVKGIISIKGHETCVSVFTNKLYYRQ